MLKQWMVGEGHVDSISVEERFVKWSEEIRSDRYCTVTLSNIYSEEVNHVHTQQVVASLTPIAHLR